LTLNLSDVTNPMASAEKIWSEAVSTLESGRPFVLATVVNVRGSTPREIGAKMLVREDGQVGTIGGGCGEAEIFRKARLLLEKQEGPRLEQVDLTGDFEQEEIGTCGGIMDVFIDLWMPKRDANVAAALADAAQRGEPAALLTLINGPGPLQHAAGSKAVLRLNRLNSEGLPVTLAQNELEQLAQRAFEVSPGLLELESSGRLKPVTRVGRSDSACLFLDPLAGTQQLVIVGAGHIAQPLCVMGAMVGFRVTVIDDRAAFANRERFPQAHAIIVRPFTAAIDSLTLDGYSYVVIVTRGHAFDECSLRATLKQHPRYVGMIGSRRRVKATLERLEADGVDKGLLARVHAPIGLDIGAETPEEIAVAIMAEIIRERRLGVSDELSLGMKLGRLKPSRQPSVAA
jgi:xanthine dehydrogenase accessory factor